jgi:hypothetical protein
MMPASKKYLICIICALPIGISISMESAAQYPGYGSFRPLEQDEQNAGPAFPQAGSFPASPSTSGNTARSRFRPLSAPALPPQDYHQYKFRDMPGVDPKTEGLPKFRPDKISGQSPYSWGQQDGKWSEGLIGPAPVFRPESLDKNKNKTKPSPATAVPGAYPPVYPYYSPGGWPGYRW